jgi:hypothetical protein
MALALEFAAPAAVRATTEPPAWEVNCDGLSSAADVLAALLVSAAPGELSACADADDYRGRRLDPDDFAKLTGDVFFAFDTPWTPTPSPSPTETRTPRPTRTRTATPSPTSSPTTTATQTALPSATPPPTETAAAADTPTPVATTANTPTATAAQTPTRSVTAVPTVTRTPTGLAQRLAGTWAANWGNQICFIGGLPFNFLADTVYTISAVDGRLDITNGAGQQIARGAEIQTNGRVVSRYVLDTGALCFNSGEPLRYLFDYTFNFSVEGVGSATATWSFAQGSGCDTCTVRDSAALLRIR